MSHTENQPIESHPMVADPAEVGVDPDALAALLARARREIDDGLLGSCQLAVAAGDRLVAYETIGDAAPDSRYVIFSCTKALVVGAFWLLLAEGTVTLDQTVAEIVPSSPPTARTWSRLPARARASGFPTRRSTCWPTPPGPNGWPASRRGA